ATAADKALAAAKLNVEAVTARIAADRATYALTSLGAASAANSPAAPTPATPTPGATTPSPEAKQLALAAGAVERRSALAQAEHKLADAEHKLALAQQALKPEDAKLKKAYEDAVKAVEAQKKARDAAQAAVAQPNENYTRFTPIYATTSTGRRLGLANWIASDSNPLTPRVAINHIWLRHFGSPLVPTVFEFGANGKPPSHPDLMDWLSRDLIDGGWSTKRVHREIVTSTAYRRASHGRGPDDPNRTLDPENKFLWRMNSRRMEAEAVRDATLAVADGLDLRMAGPDLDPAAGLTLGRRSIYFRNSKEKKMTFLSLFDSPNVTECYKRSESIAPQQALAMVNSGLTLAQARTLAKSLTTAAGGANEPERVAAFVRAAFERILCREATTAELAECQKFVAEQTQRFTD
ncbi:MAG TPA: DUF1553 domain-containing protein, partial [Pirellulaceae bacterium]|nr:DUF1553 domain-containing protein [Pirellulaceae bacterium]